MTNIKLQQGDCLELIKRLEDNSVDLIFADPPYNLSSQVYIKENGKPDLKKAKDFMDKWSGLDGEFDKQGKLARATDLIDRGYGEIQDFLDTGLFEVNKTSKPFLDIITNPPYSLAEDFLLKAMELLQENRYYCALLKITWLEGKKRKEIFRKYPPKFVYVYSQRINCAMNGDFEKYKTTAICYCWYIWQKGFKGDAIVRWI